MSRPSLDRTHTKTSEKARKETLDTGLRITVDGRTYEARLGEVTPPIARNLRRETGMGFMDLLAAMQRSPDIDLIAAFVWVARMIRGEFLPIEVVEADIDYSTLLADGFDVDVAGPESVDVTDPET